MKRMIVIEISDHVSREDAEEFVADINAQFAPHRDAYLAIGESTPRPIWMAEC
jgi:hypothetical protein